MNLVLFLCSSCTVNHDLSVSKDFNLYCAAIEVLTDVGFSCVTRLNVAPAEAFL